MWVRGLKWGGNKDCNEMGMKIRTEIGDLDNDEDKDWDEDGE